MLLGRTGSMSVLALCAAPRGAVYFVDVARLGAHAFKPALGLRALLQGAAPRKLLFDARGDANALFFHFGVALPAASVVDIQLLDACSAFGAAARAGRAEPDFFRGWRAVLGHARAVGRAEAARAAAVHSAALDIYAQDRGGSYAPWVARPLHPVLAEHAADVRFFSDVAAGLAPRDAREAAAVACATARRLAEAQSAAFDAGSKDNGRVGRELADLLAGRASPAPVPEAAAEPPPPPPPPAECVVCLDAPATHACVPCGHKCLCKGCGERERAAAAQPRCPLCREPTRDLLRVFE